MILPKLLPLLSLTLVAVAQTPHSPTVPISPSSPASTSTAAQSSPDTIRLNVLVTDKSGHAVTNLPQADFLPSDNGRVLPVLSFQSPDQPRATPTEVVLVIDAVNVGITSIEFERNQINRFLRSGDGRLPVPVSVVIFTDTELRIASAATQDGNALAANLEKQTIGLRELRRSSGFWGADERLDLSINALRKLLAAEAVHPGHKLILWISPGWPYLSGPGVDLDGKQQDALFRSVIDLSHLLQQAQVTLFSIDPLGVNDAGGLRPIYYETFLKGVTKPSQTQLADLSLQVLATHSGGRVSYGNNAIDKVLVKTVAEANSFYTLTVPRPPADQPGTYHDLQLKLEPSGLTASTTTGYYTAPEKNAPPQ